ncbi:unnamed protein product [Owenia fusiformis]|uniref:Uncharacterized protein n=1 Tax=Owenia fusiformis TaxID=6347 RepID=A0A8J1XWR0_OWEFU|nr:unnamed protein product [Owenia fusiformis]
MCQSNRTLHGKTAIVTGANCGIGKTTAFELAKRGARVILACRDVNKANQAAADILKSFKNADLIVKHLDLASLASVRKFAEGIITEEKHLDILVNNAAVFGCPKSSTEDGFENHFAVNHLGPFLLTNLLLDLLKSSAPSRVVIVSSGLAKRGKVEFDNLNGERDYTKRYPNTKLMNNLFARELHHVLNGESKEVKSGVGVHCLHPGVVNTSLGRYMIPYYLKPLAIPLMYLLLKTPTEGCQTTLYCSIAEELDNVSGCYYGNCKQEPWGEASNDMAVARKLWEHSEKLVGLN